MTAGEHGWPNGNGEHTPPPPNGCVDFIARKIAGDALSETLNVSGGLVEVIASVRGLEERLLAGFRFLGVDVQARLVEEKKARAEERRREYEHEHLDSSNPPPYRDRTSSEIQLERAARAAETFADNLERANEKSSPGFINPLLPPVRAPSDPAEAAKKVWRGTAILTARGAWSGIRYVAEEVFKHNVVRFAATIGVYHFARDIAFPWLLHLLKK
jgi:hypothetical protein